MGKQYKYDLKTIGVIWINEGEEPATVLLDKRFGPSAKGNYTWVVEHQGQWKKLIAVPVLSSKLDAIGSGKYATIAQPTKGYYEVVPSGGLGAITQNINIPGPQPEPQPGPTYDYQNPSETIPPAPEDHPIPFDEDMQRLEAMHQEENTVTTNIPSQSSPQKEEEGEMSKDDWYEKELRDIRARALANIWNGCSDIPSFKDNPQGHLSTISSIMDTMLGRWMDMVINGSELEQKPVKLYIIGKIIKYIPRPLSFESLKDIENTCSRIASEILCKPMPVDIPQPEDYMVRDTLLGLPKIVLEAILEHYSRR